MVLKLIKSPKVRRLGGSGLFALTIAVMAMWASPAAPVSMRALVPSASIRLSNDVGGALVTAKNRTLSASPIQHVVIIYQENHSFDEVLGDWCFTTGRCDGVNVAAPITFKGGAQRTLQQSPDLVPFVQHSVAAQQTAIDDGAMDGWLGVPGCGATSHLGGTIPYGCLTYFAPSQIPNLIGLATNFAVSDSTFSMADSPSWGGHLYVVAATTDHFIGDNPQPPKPKPKGYIEGPGWGCNSNKVTPWINPSTGATSMQPSCIPDPALSLPNGGAFEPTPVQYVPTIMDELDAAGLSWHIYDPSANSGWAICPSFAECKYGPQVKNIVPNTQILRDAASGALPDFSVVVPQGPNSQHNKYSMAMGDNWIGSVVSSIENGPDWDSTAIFITYDDCGCFYDHVVPETNPDGTQMGSRVPMVIVSPYAKAGYTDSTPATFASVLAYVEQNFGLAPLGVNDAGAYAFSNAFDYSQTPLAGISLYQQAISRAEQRYIAAHPADPGDDPT